MFDHAVCRPRVLRRQTKPNAMVTGDKDSHGFLRMSFQKGMDASNGNEHDDNDYNADLYASTVFGPTCVSIDVISRSVLLPKLQVGDWLYFENMGAYTSAAASTFNGFDRSQTFYVCSVMPEYFGQMIAGPNPRKESIDTPEEKKASS